jgi:hypothetical protein
MSSTSLKRNRRIVYSSDSDNSEGPLQSRPRVGSISSRDVVSNEDEEYIIPSVSISSQSASSDVDDSDEDLSRIHSPFTFIYF